MSNILAPSQTRVFIHFQEGSLEQIRTVYPVSTDFRGFFRVAVDELSAEGCGDY